MDEIESGEYEGGHKAINTEAVIAEMNKPRYYTVGDLQSMVTAQTGKPCASRNRPALLKRLGLPDVPRPADLPKTGKAASKETLKRAVADVAKASGMSVRRSGAIVDAGEPPYQKDGAAHKNLARLNKAIDKGIKADDKKRAKKKVAAERKRAASVVAAHDLHAIALRAVTAAMARKSPPSLRVLCAELAERKVLTPRGGKVWFPSSIQSLMRQAARKVSK